MSVPEQPSTAPEPTPRDQAAWALTTSEDPAFESTADEGLADANAGRETPWELVRDRRVSHPTEFGSAFVAKPGTEGHRLLHEMATGESLSVVIANIKGQEVRVNLLPIQTPTQREVGKLHDQISDLFGHRDNPLATDILIMLGQGKMKKTYPMERDLRYADLHFEYKPGPARTPSLKEVAGLIGRLRDARVNLADGFGDKRFKKIDFMDPEAWKQSQKEEVILARTLAILGQADVARRVEADENRAVVLGNPPGPVVF